MKGENRRPGRSSEVGGVKVTASHREWYHCIQEAQGSPSLGCHTHTRVIISNGVLVGEQGARKLVGEISQRRAGQPCVDAAKLPPRGYAHPQVPSLPGVCVWCEDQW